MTEYFINLSKKSKERFDLSRFMEFTDNFDVLTSRLLRDIKRLPEKQKYYVQSEEGRPDLVSYRVYRDTQFWWIVLFYNDIIDVDDLEIGMTLSLPSVTDLENLLFSLRSKELASKK